MKSQAELKRIAEEQGYYGEIQFPIHFADGTTIFQDPDLLPKPNGFPMPNAERYIAEHYPGRLSEVQRWKQDRREMFNRLDEDIKRNSKW